MSNRSNDNYYMFSNRNDKKDYMYYDRATDIAILDTNLKNLIEDIKDLRKEISDIKDDITQLTQTSNRWIGGLFVVLAFGGVIGWATTFTDKIWRFIH